MKKALLIFMFLICTTANAMPELNADIVLMQHLFEIDAVTLQSENRLLVRETMIFKNIGANFSGMLRTWVPDKAESIAVGRIAMMENARLQPLETIRNGNIISWEASIKPEDPLSLYIVEYILPAEPKGTLTKTISYSKKLAYPINYRYIERPGLPVIIIKVTKTKESSIELLDENQNRLSPDEETEEGNYVLNKFESPSFREISVRISKPAVSLANIAGYLILGVIIFISYPIVRKRSRQKGEKAKGELEGKTLEELESLKAKYLSKIEELNKEYKSGNLLDEEYEDLHASYNAKVEKINQCIIFKK